MYWNVEFHYNYIGFGILYVLLFQVYYHAGAVKRSILFIVRYDLVQLAVKTTINLNP